MEWKLPNELNNPAPRDIYRLPIFIKQWVWIFGVLGFFGVLPILIISAVILNNIHKFEVHGLVAIAHIDKSYLVKERHGWNCMVEYSFFNKERVFIDKNKTSYNNINCSRMYGRNIKIYYLKDNYNRNVPMDKNRENENSLMNISSLLLGLIIVSSCYVFLQSFFQLRREAKLMRLGCATQGWITTSAIKRQNNQRFLRVYGIYKDREENIYNFHKDFSLMYGDDGNSVLEKAKLNTTILYYPGRHDLNIMYPPKYIGFYSE
ncbi:hypothetical protein [Gluconobacter frateurii]|uniref:DUF3592 domain-containing protein n=1 Tax=Gluconobacter frateurii NRIC 0228 TaxID=1307946 RepID=A0ABQ0Q752_9PROT|nr:hypothetical protein [Gluconobacter frateurii]GBR07535.1 hypothetical protein AA0228_0036 [Gluconobacter frateurii NRIC 0228]GLP91399.1 hypothetical protein GCM10007868_24740 [Gluconobacter frateurii]